MNPPVRYSIRKSSDGQFYPVAQAPNNEIVSTGELHPRLQGAINNAIAMGCPEEQLPLELDES